MTEQNLIEAGFERVDVSAEESGGDPYYYFNLDIGDLSLITPDSDTITDGEWYVELFNYNDFKITNPVHLAELLQILYKIVKPTTDE